MSREPWRRAARSVALEAAASDPVSTLRLRMGALVRETRPNERLARKDAIAKAEVPVGVAQTETLPIVIKMSRLDPTVFIRMNLPVSPVPGIPRD